jgi:hypothetical protein
MGFSFFVEMQLPHKTAQNPISCIILANLPKKYSSKKSKFKAESLENLQI